MLRKPNEKELAYINDRIAKKTLTADDVYIFDEVSIANDFMLTSYGYYLGTSSLFNFKNDLEKNKIPVQINHKTDIPLGTWLPGEIRTVTPPEGAKQGKNYELVASLYMPMGLEINGYKTDEIVKAYQTGTLTDVSIAWTDGRPVCDICGKDYLSQECSHMVGMEYEGVTCTVTIEDAHLAECSLVWSGALPGAQLDDEIASIDWSGIKTSASLTPISGSLTIKMPLLKEDKIMKSQLALTHNSKLAENEPAWGDVDKTKLPRNAFADQGEEGKKSTWRYPHHWVKNGEVGEDGIYKSGDMYLHRGGLIAAWAAANGARSGQEASEEVKAHLRAHRKAIGLDGDDYLTFDDFCEIFKEQLEERFVAKEKFDELTKEHNDLTQKFAELNVDLEMARKNAEIGKKRLEELVSEYHRLGVILYADKWIEETKNENLIAMDVNKRYEFLLSEIKLMETDIRKNLEKKTERITTEDRYEHKDNPKYYKIG